MAFYQVSHLVTWFVAVVLWLQSLTFPGLSILRGDP